MSCTKFIITNWLLLLKCLSKVILLIDFCTIGDGHGDLSSNPGRVCLHFT